MIKEMYYWMMYFLKKIGRTEMLAWLARVPMIMYIAAQLIMPEIKDHWINL